MFLIPFPKITGEIITFLNAAVFKRQKKFTQTFRKNSEKIFALNIFYKTADIFKFVTENGKKRLQFVTNGHVTNLIKICIFI